MTRIPITDELVAGLKAERKRTGRGPAAILRGRKDIPRGLNSRVITGWLSGETKSAAPEHIAYVRERWSALASDPTIPLTKAMIRTLKAELERTGLRPQRLLSRRDGTPKGLSAPAMRSWLHGDQKRVRKDHWDFVMSGLKAIYVGLVEITPGVRAQLAAERERTGIGPMGLLKRAHDIPPGLNARLISTWLRGKTRTARPEHLSYVQQRWRALPNREQGNSNKSPRRREIT